MTLEWVKKNSVVTVRASAGPSLCAHQLLHHRVHRQPTPEPLQAPSNSSVVHTRAPPASKLAAACRGTVAAYKSAVASDDSTDVSANCCTAVRRVGNTRYKSRLSRSSDSSSYCVVAASSRSIRAPCFIRGDNALLFEP